MPTPEYRKTYILKEIEKRDSMNVGELAERLEVSEMTIRRDLIELEQEGLIKRVHGGAVNNRGRSYEPPYTMRTTQASAGKALIGAAAAGLVEEGDSLALDGGSTVYEFAKSLSDARNLTIMTPSFRNANLFVNKPEIRLILPGGIVRPGEASMIGDLTAQAFRGLFVDKLFLGVGCIDAVAGLTEYNWDDALVKRAMIKSAKRVILLADGSKFEKVAFALVAQFSEIHTLVTDVDPPAPIASRLEECGVNIIIAGSPAGESGSG